jgi:uncharacterized protein (TIGR01244 family)
MTNPSCARHTRRAGAVASIVLLLAAAGLIAQSPDKSGVAGIRNFTRVDEHVATGGAASASAMPALAALGYKTVINLRRPSEEGSDLHDARASAEAAGLHFVSLPFDGKRPDGATVEAFLRLFAESRGQPIFVHCSSGNRAGALWLVKRVVADGWAIESAAAEARVAGLSDQVLEAWVTGYAQGRQR